MSMPKILFTESSLELIPKELWSHKQIKKHAKKRNKDPKDMLLDKNYHINAMVDLGLENIEKRGRPDIVHKCLLTALDAPVVKENKMKVYLHTIDDKFITFDNSIEIPRSYNRFVGLFEQLLKRRKITTPDGKVLMKLEDRSFKNILDTLYYDKVILLSEKGEKTDIFKLTSFLQKIEAPLILIGCFPRGDFEDYVYESVDHVFSIYDDVLMAWTITGMVVHVYGESIRLGKRL